jgi:hypothetical protein
VGDAPKLKPFSVTRAAKALQDNVARSGPAASASYTLIGAILLGGAGYALTAGLIRAGRRGLLASWSALRVGQDEADDAGRLMVGVAGGLWAAVVASGRRSVGGRIRRGALAARRQLVTARVHATDPRRVTSVMVVAFGVKAVVFGVYVVAVVKGLGLRPVPFALSFAGFFIALYAVEVFFLRQMFAGAPQSVSRE